MDLEDKLVDDRELAQLELQHRSDRDEQGEQTLPEPEQEVVADVSQDQRYQLLQALRTVLLGQTVHVEQLHLPERETVALEALQIAVSGASRIGTFVYASDRRDLLERALSVLQPDLAYQADPAARELAAELIALSDRVADLRHRLTQLEDSEDELLSDHEKAQLEAAAAPPADTAAKPGQPAAKPGAAAKPAKQPARPDLAAGNKPSSISQTPPGDPDAPKPTTLTGPDVPEPPARPTTLTGPGPGGLGSVDQPAPPAPTTLAGPDAPEPRAQPTTLTGPGPGGLGSVDQPAPPAPTTLAGPDLPDEPRPPSLLDGDGPAAAAPAVGQPADDKTKKSWWRKPFG